MTGSLKTMVSYVKGRSNVSPATAVVLGSGLGHMAENVEGGVKAVSYTHLTLPTLLLV